MYLVGLFVYLTEAPRLETRGHMPMQCLFFYVGESQAKRSVLP